MSAIAVIPCDTHTLITEQLKQLKWCLDYHGIDRADITIIIKFVC